MADRAVNRLARGEPRIGAPQPGDRLDIKQRQSPAGGLFETAIGVPVERSQQTGHVPIWARADRQQRLGGAGQELVGAAIVERDALAGFEPSDKAAQLIGLRRAHPDREVACNAQIARAVQIETQRDIADRRRRQAETAAEPCTGGERDRPLGRRGEIAGAARRELQAILAGATFQIVDDDPDLAVVAGRQKARQ